MPRTPMQIKAAHALTAYYRRRIGRLRAEIAELEAEIAEAEAIMALVADEPGTETEAA